MLIGRFADAWRFSHGFVVIRGHLWAFRGWRRPRRRFDARSLVLRINLYPR